MCLSACGGGGSSSGGTAQPAGFEFAPATTAQIAAVAQAIKARDLSPRNAAVAYEDSSNSTYVLRIIRHSVNGVDHYGAVTIPTVRYTTKLPVVVELDGMDDDNPPLDLARKLTGLGVQTRDAIVVMPAFRGRTLQFAGRSWTAGGDFCDGFDGAADDTMALLNVLEATEPAADVSRLLVRGGSRGGSVALLLGQRDARVRVVSAGSAPVDFYRADAAAAYGKMFQCQFFTGKTAEQSRSAMIAASALHFPMLRSVSAVYLEHGGADATVPVLNATEMNKRLLADGVKVDLVVYPGAGHDLGQVAAYRALQDSIFYAFIQP
ncbi:prolyl oligopeptidase family serine peptidase [Roseateles sp. DJS-2-20]|uniref:Prolyl oligopeptidase family serine peptidase n=1 Tax=Roseateles paludis TaxID=3145238 RepID=A0ABV0G6T3_9BURK